MTMPHLTHFGTEEEVTQSLAEETRDALVAVCNRLRYLNVVAQMSNNCAELNEAERVLGKWIDHERN